MVTIDVNIPQTCGDCKMLVDTKDDKFGKHGKCVVLGRVVSIEAERDKACPLREPILYPFTSQERSITIK